MNKTTLIGVLFVASILGACQFNQSVDTDLITGAQSRGDGLGCDGVSMVINGKAENRNTFVYGEKVDFGFNNISGFTQEGDKVYPGLSLAILKNEKDTVSHQADLLESMNDGTDLSPLELHAHFLTALPYKNGEKYKVYIKIWDKKGDGTFTYEMPFSIEENKLLQITAKGLTYKEIYLWDETAKQVVTTKNIGSKNKFILLLEDLSGFTQLDGRVYPQLSMLLTDGKGNEILSNPNLLKDYENEGINAPDFEKGQLPITITFPSGPITNPCKLRASLTDKNSDKRIDIETALELE